jgi:hypothetical protein
MYNTFTPDLAREHRHDLIRTAAARRTRRLGNPTGPDGGARAYRFPWRVKPVRIAA